MVSLFFITLLGAMVPGASFVITVKNSLCGSRYCGIMTAVGLSLGMALHAAYLLPGLYWFQHHSTHILTLITWLGAIYLCYFGYRCLQAQPREANGIHLNHQHITPTQSFLSGFMTDAFNPKIIIFILALLSQYVGDNLSPQAQLSYGLMLVLVQLGWFSIVAFLFSSGKLKAWLYQYAHWIERASGLLLIMLSVKLVIESV